MFRWTTFHVEDLKRMDNGVIFGFAVGVGCGLCLGYFLKGKDRPSGSNSALDDGEEVSKYSIVWAII